jgi:hypothetical protein
VDSVARSSAFGLVFILATCAAVLGCHSGRYYDESVGDYMVHPAISAGEDGVLAGHLGRDRSIESRQKCQAPMQGQEADNAPIQPDAPMSGANPGEGSVPKSKSDDKSAMDEDLRRNGGGAASNIGAKMRQFDSPEGKKTFRLGDDGSWCDDSCGAGAKDAITVKYISDEYYNLLKAKPELDEYVKIGEKIVVKIAGKTYIIEGIKK